jgi:hypothetical protein
MGILKNIFVVSPYITGRSGTNKSKDLYPYNQ